MPPKTDTQAAKRLRFLQQWAAAIDGAIATIPGDPVRARVQAFWHRQRARWQRELATTGAGILRAGTDPVADFFPGEWLTRWETTFGAMNRTLERFGGTAPPMEPPPTYGERVAKEAADMITELADRATSAAGGAMLSGAAGVFAVLGLVAVLFYMSRKP